MESVAEQIIVTTCNKLVGIWVRSTKEDVAFKVTKWFRDKDDFILVGELMNQSLFSKLEDTVLVEMRDSDPPWRLV